MPRKPSKETLEAANRHLDPIKTLTAVINDMHDKELEKQLVDAGYAVKVGD